MVLDRQQKEVVALPDVEDQAVAAQRLAQGSSCAKAFLEHRCQRCDLPGGGAAAGEVDPEVGKHLKGGDGLT